MKWNRVFLSLLISYAVFAGGKTDSSVVWISFSDAWSLTEQHGRSMLTYNDILRQHDTPLYIFCRTRMKAKRRVVCRTRVSGVIDSAFFGIFCRSGVRHYDFLLTGMHQFRDLTTICRTFSVEEVISHTRRPLKTQVKLDTCWHDIGFAFSGNGLTVQYDSLNLGSFEVPFSSEGDISWGFSAQYCNVALKDLYLIRNTGSDTVSFPLDTGTVFTAPILKKSHGSSDRVLGY